MESLGKAKGLAVIGIIRMRKTSGHVFPLLPLLPAAITAALLRLCRRKRVGRAYGLVSGSWILSHERTSRARVFLAPSPPRWYYRSSAAPVQGAGE